MEWTRRRLLASTGAVTLGSVAGCIGTPTTNSASNGGERTVQTSFFVLYDFASRLVGDGTAVHNLVPFGQHGHGWEPGPDVQRAVLDASAFVYVGEGFQPWADRIVQNVRDGDADVPVIEAWHGIDLLDASADHGEGHGDHDDHDHDATGESGADDHDDHEEGHDDDHGSGHDAEHDDGHDADHDGTHDDDHDHGAKDPHFWLDPERATRAVRTIAEGLADAEGADRSAYRERADAVADRLGALDDTYHDRLSGRTNDTVLVAGHNSIRYLGHRYGFHVEALTGVAPDAEPTPKDVSRAQSVIDEHGLQYILAPVFESDRAATVLVEETDATEVLPITPVPSLTAEWRDAGWGYVDVMENVNLPTLEKALGVE